MELGGISVWKLGDRGVRHGSLYDIVVELHARKFTHDADANPENFVDVLADVAVSQHTVSVQRSVVPIPSQRRGAPGSIRPALLLASSYKGIAGSTHIDLL